MSTEHIKDLTCEHTPDSGWFASVADLFDITGVDVTILVAVAIDDTDILLINQWQFKLQSYFYIICFFKGKYLYSEKSFNFWKIWWF